VITIDAIRARLKRIEQLLEDHDQHWVDCDCTFCKAHDETKALLWEMRREATT
jgi:hypothetical protein